jgi:hypothetical protein
MRSEDDQRVEPSSGLVDTLGDEIGREGSLELFVRGAEGVVLLRVGHATGARRDGIERTAWTCISTLALTFPTRTNSQTPLEISLALLGRDGDVVNVLPVEILDPGHARQLFELFDRFDADDLRDRSGSVHSDCHVDRADILRTSS